MVLPWGYVFNARSLCSLKAQRAQRKTLSLWVNLKNKILVRRLSKKLSDFDYAFLCVFLHVFAPLR